MPRPTPEDYGHPKFGPSGTGYRPNFADRLRGAGIPTPDQEALQAPLIDPVQMAVNIPMFGVQPTLNAMLGATAMNAVGGWGARGPQIPMPLTVSNEIQDNLYRFGRDKIFEKRAPDMLDQMDALRDMTDMPRMGEVLKNYFPIVRYILGED